MDRGRATDVVQFTMTYPSKPYWVALLFPNVERKTTFGLTLCWVRGSPESEFIEVVW